MRIILLSILLLPIYSCTTEEKVEPTENKVSHNIELIREFKELSDGNQFNPTEPFLTFVSLYSLNNLDEWILVGSGGFDNDPSILSILVEPEITHRLEILQVNKGIGNFGFHIYNDEGQKYINLGGRSEIKNKMAYDDDIYPVYSEGIVSTGLMYLNQDSTDIVPQTNYDKYYTKMEFVLPPNELILNRFYNGLEVTIENLPDNSGVIFWGRMLKSFLSDITYTYYFSGIANPRDSQLPIDIEYEFKDRMYIEFFNNSNEAIPIYDAHLEWKETEVKSVTIDCQYAEEDSIEVIIN